MLRFYINKYRSWNFVDQYKCEIFSHDFNKHQFYSMFFIPQGLAKNSTSKDNSAFLYGLHPFDSPICLDDPCIKVHMHKKLDMAFKQINTANYKSSSTNLQTKTHEFSQISKCDFSTRLNFTWPKS